MRGSARWAVVAIAASCGLVGGAVAQEPPNDHGVRIARRGLEKRIDALVEPYVRLGAFDGVVLVAQGEDVLLLKPYGKASYELDVANRVDTRFRIASLSKNFTDAAIASLVDRGVLALDTTVSKYMPDFPRGSEITIDHLVNHRSGVVHTNELAELEGVTRMTLDEMIALIASKPLDFDPGAEENYSNGGYDLLARIVEKASGLTFEEYLRRFVFAPLELDDMGVTRTYAVIPGMASGYLPGLHPGERTLPRFYPAEIRFGGGALYADADDVFRAFRTTMRHEFASEEISGKLFGRLDQRYEITGRSPGFVAKVFRNNRNDITIVSLANNYSSLHSWGRRLYQAAIGEPLPSTVLAVVDRRVEPERSAWYAGEYRSERGATIRISVGGEGHLLFWDVSNDWQVALVPLQDGTHYHPFFDNLCRFEGDGRAEELRCRPVLPNLDFEDVYRR